MDCLTADFEENVRTLDALLGVGFAVETVEQHLADAFAVQTNGKVHGAFFGKVLAHNVEEVGFQILAIPVRAIVVAPPLVALIVET